MKFDLLLVVLKKTHLSDAYTALHGLTQLLSDFGSTLLLKTNDLVLKPTVVSISLKRSRGLVLSCLKQYLFLPKF